MPNWDHSPDAILARGAGWFAAAGRGVGPGAERKAGLKEAQLNFPSFRADFSALMPAGASDEVAQGIHTLNDNCGVSDIAGATPTLQTINGLRDTAQHHLLDITEAQLYVHAQSGVTLFRDLLRSVFGLELSNHLPERVLPVSTIAPTDIVMLFDNEIEEIRKLLSPGKRKRTEAIARLRSLAILDTTIEGEKGQPSATDLNRACQRLQVGEAWTAVFKGVAAIQIVTEGEGPSISLRLSKKAGIETVLVDEGTPGASVVALKTTDATSYYSLTATKLGEKLELTRYQVLNIIGYLGLKENNDCYREFKMDSQCHKRYSPKAIEAIRKALQVESVEEIVEKMKQRKRERKKCHAD